MPTVELSPEYVKSMLPGLFRLSDGINRDSEYPSGSGLLNTGASIDNYVSDRHGLGAIWLMKGSIPSSFTEITNLNSRLSDVLCKFHTGAQAEDFSPTTVSNNPVNVSTVYKTAEATGTATWFWWHVSPRLTGNFSTYEELIDPTANLLHNIYGSVGLTLSGADLEMENVNIVAGQDYRISDLPLRFPTTWTY
jgi:hypothetical protein